MKTVYIMLLSLCLTNPIPHGTLSYGLVVWPTHSILFICSHNLWSSFSYALSLTCIDTYLLSFHFWDMTFLFWVFFFSHLQHLYARFQYIHLLVNIKHKKRGRWRPTKVTSKMAMVLFDIRVVIKVIVTIVWLSLVHTWMVCYGFWIPGHPYLTHSLLLSSTLLLWVTCTSLWSYVTSWRLWVTLILCVYWPLFTSCQL